MSRRTARSPWTHGCARRRRRWSESAAAVRGSFGRCRGRRGRRGRFGRPPNDCLDRDGEGDEAQLLVVFDLLPGPSNGGTTAVGAVAPRRPSESERGSSGASGGETGEERGRSTARRGPPLNDAGRGGDRQRGGAGSEPRRHGGPGAHCGDRKEMADLQKPPCPILLFLPFLLS